MKRALFHKHPIEAVEHHIDKKINEKVASYPEAAIESLDVEEAAKEIKREIEVKTPELHEDQSSKKVENVKERMSKIRDDDRRLHSFEGDILMDAVKITKRIPFDGEEDLFDFLPSTHSSLLPRGDIEGKELVLEEIVRTDEAKENVEKYLDKNLKLAKEFLGRVKSDVDRYNSEIEAKAKRAIEKRKKLIADRKKFE